MQEVHHYDLVNKLRSKPVAAMALIWHFKVIIIINHKYIEIISSIKNKKEKKDSESLIKQRTVLLLYVNY